MLLRGGSEILSKTGIVPKPDADHLKTQKLTRFGDFGLKVSKIGVWSCPDQTRVFGVFGLN
jgi:hypothetical protein